MDISNENLLFRVSPHGIPAVTGTKNNPKPVIFNVTEVEVVVIITKVSSIFDCKKNFKRILFLC